MWEMDEYCKFIENHKFFRSPCRLNHYCEIRTDLQNHKLYMRNKINVNCLVKLGKPINNYLNILYWLIETLTCGVKV